MHHQYVTHDDPTEPWWASKRTTANPAIPGVFRIWSPRPSLDIHHLFLRRPEWVASRNGKRWTPRNKHKSWRNKDSFSFLRKSFNFAYYTDDSFQPWIMKMCKKLRILPNPQTDMVNTANRMLHKGLPNSFPALETAFRKHCPGRFLPPDPNCVCVMGPKGLSIPGGHDAKIEGIYESYPSNNHWTLL